MRTPLSVQPVKPLRTLLRSALRTWLPAALALLTALAIGASSPVFAQDKVAHYTKYAVDLLVQADGRVRVREAQTVRFDEGTFTTGNIHIDRLGLTGLEVVGVEGDGQAFRRGGDQPGSYTVETSSSDYTIRWTFEPTAGRERRFVVTYLVDGAVRFYDGGDQLWWKALRADRPDVDEVSITAGVFSEVAGLTQALAYRLPANEPLETQTVDPRTTSLTVNNVPRGDEIEVRIEWPHGLVAGTPAPWQQRYDAQVAQVENPVSADQLASGQVTLLNLLIALLATLVLVGGLFGLYVLWYLRGRDAPFSLPTDYLAEPPSDLPPGVAGALVDERADLQDVLATLLDLARRGELSIEEERPATAGFGAGFDYVFKRHLTGQALATFEQRLLGALFPAGDDSQRLSELKGQFRAHIGEIQDSLYRAAIDAGLFPESPESVRRSYRSMGLLLLGGGLLFSCGSLTLADHYPALLMVPGAVLVLALVLIPLSQHMPRKTVAGSEAAVRWLAFRRYLADIEKYRDLQEAHDIFAKYLPYTVAFGLDKTWLEKWRQVPVEAPPWYQPSGPTGPVSPGGGPWDLPGRWPNWPRRPGWGWGPYVSNEPGPFGAGGRAGTPPPGANVPAAEVPRGGGGGVPDLNRASEGLGQGLQGLSEGLSTLLNAASTAFTLPAVGDLLSSLPTDVPTVARPSRGGGWKMPGGWSGGGRGGGGGSGGGGGGFG